MTETRGSAARRPAHARTPARRKSESGRRRARELAFRVAYEADVNGDAYAEAWRRLAGEERLTQDQRQLIDDVVARLADPEIDRHIREAAEHWPMDRLSATDRAVLRAATAELAARPGSPLAVVIDEAIEIAKRFGSDDSGRFVNGVLDQIARALRPGER